MPRSLFAALLLLPLVAFAGETVQVKTPTSTVQAEKFVNPPATTVEGVILESMKMIEAGQWDAWMAKHCHPDRCPDIPEARESMKTYNFPATQGSAKLCMFDNKTSILVTRRVQDQPDKQTVYIYCGESRMPAPSTLIKVGDKWLVSSFSW